MGPEVPRFIRPRTPRSLWGHGALSETDLDSIHSKIYWGESAIVGPRLRAFIRLFKRARDATCDKRATVSKFEKTSGQLDDDVSGNFFIIDVIVIVQLVGAVVQRLLTVLFWTLLGVHIHVFMGRTRAFLQYLHSIPLLEGREVGSLGLVAETCRIGRLVVVVIELLQGDALGEVRRKWKYICFQGLLAHFLDIVPGDFLPCLVEVEGAQVVARGDQAHVLGVEGHVLSLSTVGQGVGAAVVLRTGMDKPVLGGRAGAVLDLVAMLAAIAAAVATPFVAGAAEGPSEGAREGAREGPSEGVREGPLEEATEGAREEAPGPLGGNERRPRILLKFRSAWLWACGLSRNIEKVAPGKRPSRCMSPRRYPAEANTSGSSVWPKMPLSSPTAKLGFSGFRRLLIPKRAPPGVKRASTSRVGSIWRMGAGRAKLVSSSSSAPSSPSGRSRFFSASR
ncbi:hypothetical protein PG984_011979 [Apiospora sp. TS-2023a]